MYYRKLVNFYVFILSILTVNLLSDKITEFLLGFRFMDKPVKATAIGMAVLVFVLYPAYNFLDDWSGRAARRIFKAGRNAAGKFLGVTLVFLACLFILFLFYLHLWFGWNAIFGLLK